MIERSGIAYELDDGYSEEISPCPDCIHWSIEIWIENGIGYVRELHDATCPELARVESRMAAEAGDEQ